MITPAVRTRVADLDSAELPAYIHDTTHLRAHAASVRAALPARVELYYAAKANPAPEILTALAGDVNGYEVSSGGELAHVRAHLPTMPVAFGGPGKTVDELTAALHLDVGRFHVESPYEARRLVALAARTRPDHDVDVLLRVNLPLGPDVLRGAALTMGGDPGPFGMDPDDVESCLRALRGPDAGRVRVRGIHAHLASGLDADRRLALAEGVLAWARDIADRHGITRPEVNIGGGMAVDYTNPTARFDWARFGAGLDRLVADRPDLIVRIEPGRALTAYSGWYATEVVDLKHSRGRAFAVLRGGTHHLRTPAAKGHDQPCVIVPTTSPWPHSWPRPEIHHTQVTLTGQLCTPKDVFARDRAITELRVGDRIAFALAGAYAWNISHHDFLMHPHPTFHYL
ncbi:type III PLP-dependent enzyme (plasmid) [Embleya sp. NBC_00888]|uniref:type III PLP-dependent enzyme n=1 Tax=Embleya sp. NBC_00888 TaxID=2975960 RepID=UPI002F90C7D4|nr:type III PLP-dependent enzyme [Embleya sp. NBC_00888]